MTARPIALNLLPVGASMGRVSVHRAACGRWCGRASPALQNLPLHGTRQNTRPMTTRLRTIAELTALTFLQTEGRLRTRKPFIHAVVAVPSVVAVQKAPPRTQCPPEPLSNLPGGCLLGLGLMPWHGGQRATTPPPSTGPPVTSKTRVIAAASKR